MGLEIFILKSLQHSSEEATNDELCRLLRRNAAGHHVEEFVLIEFAGSRAMSAADIIGKDLKSGHGVGLRLIAEHEVADLLIGVGLVRVLLDLDQAGEDRA